jgi:calcineurin-like phosphoesterase family protein
MNCSIIKSINDTVGANDELRFLGDWSFGGVENITILRNYINCKNIHLIYGNHDTSIRKDEKLQLLFKSCKDYDEIIVNNKLIVLSHYSFRVWNKSHRGSYHFFGHSHNALPDNGNSLDVGWCKWRKPLSFIEIDKILSEKTIPN